MAEQKIVKIACRACGHKFAVKHPGRDATLKYTCPACGAMVPVRFKSSPAPVPMGGGFPAPASKPAAAPAASMPATIIADNPGAGTYSGTFMRDSDDSGRAVLRVTIHRALLPDSVRDFDLSASSRLTIGREDDELVSDIAVPGDSSISRRCAVIEESSAPGSRHREYRLRVVKTLNPVRVNDRVLNPGEAVGLNHGDVIVMGRTPMQFLVISKK